MRIALPHLLLLGLCVHRCSASVSSLSVSLFLSHRGRVDRIGSVSASSWEEVVDKVIHQRTVHPSIHRALCLRPSQVVFGTRSCDFMTARTRRCACGLVRLFRVSRQCVRGQVRSWEELEHGDTLLVTLRFVDFV